MTVADLITAAFRRINVVESNAVPDPDDQSDGFLRFKAMLGQWRLQKLTIPIFTRVTWMFTATKGTPTNPYTMGPAPADIVVPVRPPKATDFTWCYADVAALPQEQPLDVLTEDDYIAIPQKTATAPYPQQVFYQPAYPLGAVYVWPVATKTNVQGIVYAPVGVQDPVATTSTLVVPDGYDLALIDNLAVLLWAEWRQNVPVDPGLQLSARESLSWLKTNNVRRTELGLDAMWIGRGGVYDIYSDTTR